jgi:CPA1 family monovalent cation:H+ antiporter
MSTESVFILLFIIATAVAIFARWWHVPYTVGLVLAGLLLGFVHILPAPELTQELLFAVFLPGLVFEAAFHLDYSEFVHNCWAIILLAVPGVVGTMAGTAAILVPAAHSLGFAAGFDWRYGLVFGALIAATDPISVVAMLRTLGAPRRLALLMEGESLLNDGTGIVFFVLSLAVVSGTAVSAGDLTLQFIEIVGLGALMGIAVGTAVSQVIRHVNEPVIEITLTTIAAYGAFILADHFHYSGIIATVAAGMVCGNYGAPVGMSASTRVAVETFWQYVAFALNSIVFLLIGFELNVRSLLSHWLMILIAYLAVLLARGVVVLGVAGLLHRTRERFPLSWGVVQIWGGLRGALPMVLALSLPRDFAYRELVINMTFGVVAISILVHGLSMSPLLRLLGIVRGRERRLAYELARGRVRMARSALAELDRVARTGAADADILDSIHAEYDAQLHAASEEIHGVHLKRDEILREEQRAIRRQLILVEKRELIEALHAGLITSDVYAQLLADADARLLAADSEPPPPPAQTIGRPGSETRTADDRESDGTAR